MRTSNKKLLQVALDLPSAEDAFHVLEEIGDYIDVIEIGTPLIIAEGSHLVSAIKRKYTDKIVFADIKVMDGGNAVPQSVLKAGADMISVLSVADDETIQLAIATAHQYGSMALIDFCECPDISGRAKELIKHQPDYMCVHVGYDVQKRGIDPLIELHKLDDIPCKKAVAGGIKLATFEAAASCDADIIIVGGGLYAQEDMRGIAKKMREMLDRVNGDQS